MNALLSSKTLEAGQVAYLRATGWQKGPEGWSHEDYPGQFFDLVHAVGLQILEHLRVKGAA